MSQTKCFLNGLSLVFYITHRINYSILTQFKIIYRNYKYVEESYFLILFPSFELNLDQT